MAAIEDVIPESAAAKFGFSRPGASGHAVAVWRKGKATDTNDAFWILDPNLGVFAANQDGMLYMLQVLFWYDADRTPFYKTCAESTGRTRVNYMIWQRAPGALV
jgi:hypothetical protein